MTSASTSSWSNLLPSVSLSEVVTRVWPWDSIHSRRPSSFSVVPNNLGSCFACSKPFKRQQNQLSVHIANSNWSFRKLQLTSYKTIRTLPCRCEVAVSVLTPPRPAVLASEAPRCESAGLSKGWAARRAERANTILKKDYVIWRERECGKETYLARES